MMNEGNIMKEWVNACMQFGREEMSECMHEDIRGVRKMAVAK
jgi:hypothetical protein